MTKDSSFEIALELAAPGNIWGIVCPPNDWFPIHNSKPIDEAGARREQSIAPQIERQAAPIHNEESAHLAHRERNDPAVAISPSLNRPIAGFDEPIQVTVSHEATAALVEDRERLLGEFLTQHTEAITRRVLKDLSDEHGSAVRINYERWNQQIEQDVKHATQGIAAQAVEISRRVEGMTVTTIDRLQSNMEASCGVAVERFLSSLREQLAPLLKDAQVTLQDMAVFEDKLRNEYQSIRDPFDKLLQQATQNAIAEVRETTLGILDQFECDVTKKVAESHEGLHERSVEVIEETTEHLRELSKGMDETIQVQLRSLVSSAADDLTKVLKERTTEISRQFWTQLQGSTRRYLELINESVPQNPKKTTISSDD